MKERQKLGQRNTYTPGKSIVIKGGEKKMDISTKKVKIVKYGKGLRFTTQSLLTLPHGVSLEGLR